MVVIMLVTIGGEHGPKDLYTCLSLYISGPYWLQLRSSNCCRICIF